MADELTWSGWRVIVVSDILKRQLAGQEDLDRLILAAQRLGDAAEVCNVR